MLTKQPDYTITELGYPQLLLQQQMFTDVCYKKKYRPQAPSFRVNCTHSPSHSTSSSRLLPLRETLDDYNKRLLSEQSDSTAASRQLRDLDDTLAQQKRQKNLWNEHQQKRKQPQQQQQWNTSISNQKCRDIQAQAKRPTMLTSDLNSF